MPVKFKMNEAEHYGGRGAGSFFQLKNDKDTARVRFMYNGIDDIYGYAVHQVMVDGKQRYVACLREYTQPIDDCPFCAAKIPVRARLFLFLYDVDTDEVKVWERGRSFFSKMASLASRYNPLVSTVFEIERNGKPGDTNTTYETYHISTDDTRIEDLPEIPDIVGTIILQKEFEDMVFYLDNGYFPDEGVVARPQRGGAQRSASDNQSYPIGRRTPANAPTRGRRTPAAPQDVF
jgi:hypothetical protein